MDLLNTLRVGMNLNNFTAVALVMLDERRRQRMRVHRQCTCVCQRPRIRYFCKRNANEEFTDELWILHFGLTSTAFNNMCRLLHQNWNFISHFRFSYIF